MLDRVGLYGSGWAGGYQDTMSALLPSTSVSSMVWYGPLMLAAVCRLTVMFGYFLWNAVSMLLIAFTAGGLSQVMILMVPDAEPDEPELQAAAVSASAPATEPARSPRVRRRRGLAGIG